MITATDIRKVHQPSVGGNQQIRVISAIERKNQMQQNKINSNNRKNIHHPERNDLLTRTKDQYNNSLSRKQFQNPNLVSLK